MKKLWVPFLLVILSMVVACSVRPKPIDYGQVGCHYCSMTIVDKQHAAQLVTDKGKVYNFDAIECMMNHLKDVNDKTIGLYLVNDYEAPGNLIAATGATYLISKEIPSPMGEFLTAFSSEDAAQRTRAKHQGNLYSWSELREKFKK